MSDPIYPISCPQGQWTKIATDVIVGQVWRMEKNVIYYHTYRLTGEAAPITIDEGVLMFKNGVFEIISANQNIDIYVWCKNGTGSHRRDNCPRKRLNCATVPSKHANRSGNRRCAGGSAAGYGD